MKRLQKNVLYTILLVLTLIFVSTQLELSQFEFLGSDLSFMGMGSAFLLFNVGYVFLAFSWLRLLREFTYLEKEQVAPSYLSFFNSQIFKYLPSSIFTFASRLLFTREIGLSTNQVTRAVIWEALLMIASASLLFILLVFPVVGIAILAISILLGIIFIRNPNLLQLLPQNWLTKKIKTFWDKNTISFQTLAYSLVISAIGWIFLGLALGMFIWDITGEQVNVFQTIGYSSGSYAGSILAVFASGGIGVREYILDIGGVNDNIVLNWRIVTTVFDVVISVATISLFVLLPSKSNYRKNDFA